jgi:NAD(P)-dependent dehydrogenase (short-subunit alcohol dehydrogenase family)
VSRIVVTGASGGIGRAIAVRLSAGGRTVYVHGRNKDALNATSEEVKAEGADAIPLQYDLSKPEAIDQMVGEIGDAPIDALVHNAGIATVKPVEELTFDEWQQTLAVNVTAPFLLTQKLLPYMKEHASIVFIMSVAAKQGFPGWSAYCMSKFAAEGFSQSLREELRSRQIRVINIYPAATDTGIWDGIEGDFPREAMMSPEQTADAVAFALERPSSVLVENITIGSVGGNL